MTGLLRPAAKRETDERALNASGSRSPIVYLLARQCGGAVGMEGGQHSGWQSAA